MSDKNLNNKDEGFLHKIDKSAVMTIIGIILLFSTAVGVTLIAPRYIDSSWTSPSSIYQVQMWEVADPNVYISTSHSGGADMQFVYHIKEDYTLLSFTESKTARIVAPPELEPYITRLGEPQLKLTSRLLLLRAPEKLKGPKSSAAFDGSASAEALQLRLQGQWERDHPQSESRGEVKPHYMILELYVPEEKEAFAVLETDGLIENWVDQNFVVVDSPAKQHYHGDEGVVYVKNPKEYRFLEYNFNDTPQWTYNTQGRRVRDLAELKGNRLGFLSRQELIRMGEHIFAIEGCWYCHTDQTRTLIQDLVLNGAELYPAPPSSANEYTFDKITFPGTRRIGPDLSRVGVKKRSRDWHKGHFWSPKTESPGTIMPAFRHFFDNDPRGSPKSPYGIPNYRFEAIFQYLMTKGTRITPPTQAWWLGKDPIDTLGIIEGKRKNKEAAPKVE